MQVAGTGHRAQGGVTSKQASSGTHELFPTDQEEHESEREDDGAGKEKRDNQSTGSVRLISRSLSSSQPRCGEKGHESGTRGGIVFRREEENNGSRVHAQKKNRRQVPDVRECAGGSADANEADRKTQARRPRPGMPKARARKWGRAAGKQGREEAKALRAPDPLLLYWSLRAK